MTAARPTASVVICAHNPDRGRLERVLSAIGAQAGDVAFEILLIDNASTPPLDVGVFPDCLARSGRVIREPLLGLSHARTRGFREAATELVILVDDDNVICPDFLSEAIEFMNANPEVGASGGPCVPEYESVPSPEMVEFMPLLALRDLGPDVRIESGIHDGVKRYPAAAPIGAGMVIRRSLALRWIEACSQRKSVLTDRRGKDLTSSGDNDIVFSVIDSGASIAYVPALHVTHLIPAGRVSADYLARLNHGIQKSWMQVLTLHGANPWPPITAIGARLRQLRAWWRTKPWQSDAANIRWRGHCGHFEGRIS